MPLPRARIGEPLKVLQRQVDYSFWPMRRTNRRYGLQSRVFATDPWAVIRHSIDQRCPAASKPQAQAFREQAQDYFKAAEVAGLFTTKPVLLYYSFLNIAKAFVLTKGLRPEYAAAFHGLKERLQPPNVELVNSTLEAIPSGANVNIFDDFLNSIRGAGLAAAVTFPLPRLLPQLLQGHRLWCAAAQEHERFIEVTRLDLMQASGTKQLWLVLNFFEDDLTRLGVAHNVLLRGAGLNTRFREVTSAEEVGQRRLLKFEQVAPVAYTHRASDKVAELVALIKHDLWSNVLSVPPYRKYYVYNAPNADRPFVLPQLASILAFFYYLGSVTRYKPQKIAGLLRDDFGAQLEECVVNLPRQFLYLIASEFSHQEVSRAAIV
jgi:hypothetical protein